MPNTSHRNRRCWRSLATLRDSGCSPAPGSNTASANRLANWPASECDEREDLAGNGVDMVEVNVSSFVIRTMKCGGSAPLAYRKHFVNSNSMEYPWVAVTGAGSLT